MESFASPICQKDVYSYSKQVIGMIERIIHCEIIAIHMMGSKTVFSRKKL